MLPDINTSIANAAMTFRAKENSRRAEAAELAAEADRTDANQIAHGQPVTAAPGGMYRRQAAEALAKAERWALHRRVAEGGFLLKTINDPIVEGAGPEMNAFYSEAQKYARVLYLDPLTAAQQYPDPKARV